MFKDSDYISMISVWSLNLWERKKMCESRRWNKIYTGEPFGSEIEVFAERSDGVLFSVCILVKNNAIFIKAALDKLESYRTCSCQTSEACIKHLSVDQDIRFDPNSVLRSEIR